MNQYKTAHYIHIGAQVLLYLVDMPNNLPHCFLKVLVLEPSVLRLDYQNFAWGNNNMINIAESPVNQDIVYNETTECLQHGSVYDIRDD